MNKKSENLAYHFKVDGKQIPIFFKGDINLLRFLQAEFLKSEDMKEVAHAIDDYIDECKARQHFIIIASDESAIGMREGAQQLTDFIEEDEMEI